MINVFFERLATIQAIEDTKNGKNLSKSFDSVDEMFEELEK